MGATAPAVQPPEKLESITPKGIKEKINDLIDYAEATHLEEIKLQRTDGSSSVDVARGGTGLIITITFGTDLRC